MAKHICLICGEEFESGKTNAYSCDKCESKIRLIKKMEMVDKAQRELEKRTGKMKSFKPKRNMSKYVKPVKERVMNGIDNFSSMPEAVVAIQMERIGLKYETQKEIAGKKADFVIPEIKIILEIDGELYHTDEDKSFLRDRQIMAVMDEEWEIVHIHTEEVPMYTWNLREALPFVVTQRNDRFSFRNSMYDSQFLEQFRDLELHLKGVKHYECYNPKQRSNDTIQRYAGRNKANEGGY